MSRDPKFSVGAREVDVELSEEPTNAVNVAIRDGPLRVVPEQAELSNFASDPTIDSTTQVSVVDAATDTTSVSPPVVEHADSDQDVDIT